LPFLGTVDNQDMHGMSPVVRYAQLRVDIFSQYLILSSKRPSSSTDRVILSLPQAEMALILSILVL
jgi:hypothetical protein